MKKNIVFYAAMIFFYFCVFIAGIIFVVNGYKYVLFGSDNQAYYNSNLEFQKWRKSE